MVVANTDQTEYRKEVWRAVREQRTIIRIVPPDDPTALDGLPPGITVYEDDAKSFGDALSPARAVYCDGRVPARPVGKFGGRKVVYIPLVEPAEEA